MELFSRRRSISPSGELLRLWNTKKFDAAFTLPHSTCCSSQNWLAWYPVLFSSIKSIPPGWGKHFFFWLNEPFLVSFIRSIDWLQWWIYGENLKERLHLRFCATKMFCKCTKYKVKTKLYSFILCERCRAGTSAISCSVDTSTFRTVCLRTDEPSAPNAMHVSA